MLDRVTLRFEDGGRPLPRHRLAFPNTEYEGRFSFKETYCPQLRRTVFIARLAGPAADDILPWLYDAKFVYCEDGEASVTGLDFDTINSKFTAQAWHVRFAGAGTR